MPEFLVTFERRIVSEYRIEAQSVADVRRHIEEFGAHEVAIDSGNVAWDETKVKKIVRQPVQERK